MALVEKLHDLTGRFMSISFGGRIAISTLFGALGSSALIGFLADLGAVNYALAYGARLPTEGVPYLRYAVAAIFLAIFLIAFAVLFLLNTVMIMAIHQFLADARFCASRELESLANVPLKQYVKRGVLPAFGATFVFCQLFVLVVPRGALPDWVLLAVAFVATAVILVLARRPMWSKWLILSVFAAAIGTFFVFAFTPSLYGKALNFARLGGGVKVHLNMSCENEASCEPEIVGSLFLRTTEAYVLRDEKNQKFREIPSRLVEGVSYAGEERWGTK